MPDTYPGIAFCYLRGGLSGSRCAGAKRSQAGEFYWTTDATICKESKAAMIDAVNCEFELNWDFICFV